MKRVAALLLGVVLVTASAQAGTISFTPVPNVDMNQDFNITDNLAPTVYEVRLAQANAATIGSIDVTVGSAFATDAGSLAVSIPDATGWTFAPSFQGSFPLNSQRHPGQPDPVNPYVLPGSYTEGFKFGGFAFVPQPTSAGILLGTMRIDPLTVDGFYTFGVSSAADGNRSKLAGGSIPTGQIETLQGRVAINVVPEPTTIALLGIAALGLIRRRTTA